MEAQMEEKSTATLEKIQQAAMEEFSEKGFQGASLRPVSYTHLDVYKRQI